MDFSGKSITKSSTFLFIWRGYFVAQINIKNKNSLFIDFKSILRQNNKKEGKK